MPIDRVLISHVPHKLASARILQVFCITMAHLCAGRIQHKWVCRLITMGIDAALGARYKGPQLEDNNIIETQINPV